MVEDPEYIKLEGIEYCEMSSTRHLLSARNSRRISDNNLPGMTLQRSIDETVEQNPSKRVGLHQACRDGLTDCAERLIRNSPQDCNTHDDTGLTPLHQASRGNYVQIMRLLLDAGADINAKTTKDYLTPLMCASKFGAYDACRLLIQNGADVLQTTCGGQTSLHYAARKGYVKIVEVLMNDGKAPADLEDNDKATPLHTAAQAGQVEVIQKLIFHEGDLSLRDNDGYTPIHLAAREGHVKAFKEMIRKATNGGLSARTLLNSPDNYGNACLHLAIKTGFKQIVALCLEYGADVSVAQPSDFSTPLHLACSQGNLGITRLLVEYGAKIESEDGNGLTPLLRASFAGDVRIIEFLLEQGAQLYPAPDSCTPSPLMCAVKRSRHEAVAYFMSRGFPLSKWKDMNWRTVLHVAVACADIQTVDLILENDGCHLLENKDQCGKTCLHYAAVKCNEEIIARLIGAGADVRVKDNEERIPLHMAAEGGFIGVVRLLLRACPETINDIDYRSRTPLHCAASEGKVEVATHLLENGAAVDYRDDDRLTPLFHASIHGCPCTIGTLMLYGADINALEKNRKTPLIKAGFYGNLAAFRQLLKYGADPTIVSTRGFNCLDGAIIAGRQDICMEIVKNEKWREILSNRKYEGITPMRRLIEQFPQVAKLVMDKCIERSTHLDTDPNYSVTYDFSLIAPKFGEDIDIKNERYCGAKTMLNSCRHELLFHPLTREMMRMKWRRIGLTVFFLGAFLYFLFLCLLSHYLYCGHSFMPDIIVDKVITSNGYPSHCKKSLLYAQEIIMILFCCGNFLLEAYQLYSERWLYLDVANLLEVSTYMATLITLLPADGSITDTTQWASGIIALLLAFITMLVQLQLLFCSGIYVTMLFEVLKSVLKVVLVFSMLVIAYGLIFFLLLGDELSYTSPLMSILKVFDMMAGGVEFNHYFVDKDLPMPVLARFICFTFILIVSISLMNLLIGLAVGDIEAVQKNAELKRLSTQIEAIFQFEEKLSLNCRKKLYSSHMVIWPNRASFLTKVTWHLGLTDYLPWRQEPTTSTDEEKEDRIQEQLTEHRDNIMEIRTELRAQRTILENISAALGASGTSNERSLLNDI